MTDFRNLLDQVDGEDSFVCSSRSHVNALRVTARQARGIMGIPEPSAPRPALPMPNQAIDATVEDARLRAGVGPQNERTRAQGEIVNPAVAVFGILRFSPEKIVQVLPHLKVLVEATRKNDGCITYDVAEDPFDPGLIRFSELWPDQASLDRHLQAAHIEPWRAAAREFGLLERSFTAYEIAGSRKV